MYIDLRATMSEWRNRGVVSDRDERKQEEMAAAIGMKRGWWSQEKDLLPCDAALIDQLYDVGADDTARTKDLVNHRTRRAAGYNYLYTHKTLNVRNQMSCGSDMFSGFKTEYFMLEFSGHNPKAQYHWRKKSHEPLGSIRHKEIDVGNDIKRGKKYFTMQMENIREQYGEEKLPPTYDYWENENVSTTHGQKIRWLLEHYTDEQWWHLFGYFGRSTGQYKGECGWVDVPCLHHDGPVKETVPVYWVDDDENPLYIETEWAKWDASWEIRYPNGHMRYLYDLDDPDEFLANHIEDDYVIKELSKSAQRCRTESRDWLRSTWHESVEVPVTNEEGEPVMIQRAVLDEDGNETGEMEDTDVQMTRFVLEERGTRGHYCLKWWAGIIQKRERDAVIAELARKDGEVENGWCFIHDGNMSGYWQSAEENTPIAFQVAYVTIDKWGNRNTNTLPFIFNDPQKALNFIIDASPHLTASYKSAGGIPLETLFVTQRNETYRIPFP